MLKARPISFRGASAYVAKYHRHNKPPRGCKFCVSAVDGKDKTVGVLMCGRPIARHFDDGVTLEINRTCTEGGRNVNSFLYGVARKVAKAMGYERVITYTQLKETGVSLKAAGFVRIKELVPRRSWRDSSGSAHKKTRTKAGTGDIARVLWEVRFGS